MINAVIQVGGAIKAGEADWAFAAIVGPVVDAPAPVLAGVVPFCAKGYLLLAVLAHESWGALASVGLYEVDAGWVIRALVVLAVVDVVLASKSLVPGGAVATVAHRLIVNRDIDHDLRSRYIRQSIFTLRATDVSTNVSPSNFDLENFSLTRFKLLLLSRQILYKDKWSFFNLIWILEFRRS